MTEMARRQIGRPAARWLGTRWLGALLACAAMVAAVSALIWVLMPHVSPLYLVGLYLLIVVLAAVLRGTWLAVSAVLLSAVTMAYLFLPPSFSLAVDDQASATALAFSFLATAVVAGQLATRLRRAARESARLSREQAALRRVAVLVAKAVPQAAVFDAVTREVGRLCEADLARMERYEEDGTVAGVAAWSRVPAQLAVGTTLRLDGPSIARDVLQTQGPVRVRNFTDAEGSIAEEAQALGIRSSVGCPIVVAGRLWGVIAASAKRDEPFPPNTEAQIASFTELVATAIANAESRSQLAASRARVVAAADETRRRLERDLHDGAQQRLVTLTLGLRLAEESVPADLPELQEHISKIASDLTEVQDELRELSRGIHPAILSEHGLGPALRTLARRSAVAADLRIDTGARYPAPLEVAAYFVVSEALTNMAKHASASHAEVAVEEHDGVLWLCIRDNGVGGAEPQRGSGLIGLHDRVEALGGTITVISPPGRGTTIEASLPIRQPDRAALSAAAEVAEADGQPARHEGVKMSAAVMPSTSSSRLSSACLAQTA